MTLHNTTFSPQEAPHILAAMHASHIAASAAAAAATNAASPQQPPTSPTTAPLMMAGNRPPKCRIDNCELTFESYYKREIHERTHFGGEVPYPCPVKGCKKGYNVVRSLHSHIRARHPEKMGKYGVPPISKTGGAEPVITNGPSLMNPLAAASISQQNGGTASGSTQNSPLFRPMNTSSGSSSPPRRSPHGSLSPRRRGSVASMYSRSSPSPSPPRGPRRSYMSRRSLGIDGINPVSGGSTPASLSPRALALGLAAANMSNSQRLAAAASLAASIQQQQKVAGQKRSSLSDLMDPTDPSKRARLSPRGVPSHSPPPLVLSAHSSRPSSGRSSASPERMVLRSRAGRPHYPSISLPSSPPSGPRPSPVCPPPSMIAPPPLEKVDDGRNSPPTKREGSSPKPAANTPRLADAFRISNKALVDTAASGGDDHDVEMISETIVRSGLDDVTSPTTGLSAKMSTLDLSRVAPPPEMPPPAGANDSGVPPGAPPATSHYFLPGLRRPSDRKDTDAEANVPGGAGPRPEGEPHSAAALARKVEELERFNAFLQLKLTQKGELLHEAERMINAFMLRHR